MCNCVLSPVLILYIMSSKQDTQSSQRKRYFLKFLPYLGFASFSTGNKILVNLQGESEVCVIGVKGGVCCVFIKKTIHLNDEMH